MYDSWTVNWYLIANVLTVALVVISYLVMRFQEKKDQSQDAP